MARAEAKVEEALQRGDLRPAMKGWATALCRTNEASFDRFLARSVPAYAHLLDPSRMSGRPPSADTAAQTSPVAEAVCAQLGLKPGALSE